MSARSTATLGPETLDKRELLKAPAPFRGGDFLVESGACHRMAKPVDINQLFWLMRVWTHDRRHGKAYRAGAAV
jgi:hypothetical protein